MPVTVIQESPQGEPVVNELSDPATTPEAAVEAVADTALAVAETEAARDITIAQINADVAVAEIEARQETQESETEWQTRLALMQSDKDRLEAENTRLQAELEALQAANSALLTLEATMEAEEVAESLTAPEPPSTPEYIAEPETVTESGESVVVESPPGIPPLVSVARKPVIRLV